ncbi:MFS transporter [Motilibacter rhizosphaerae]|uniref:MFS transporter n=1 Tax=Motilibacter rhizosphaerae TaxID=598652 RepID=A0A4V2F540_9ACTN|nr:MFS transporter [Motilibacter rhizosphaerae]RZS91489.1 MFS transporter [Motilibacter rhizosphaerae]
MTTSTTTPRIPSARPTVSEPRPDRRWLVLGLLVTGLFMAMVDATIVNVALGSIRADLDVSGAGLELVVSGYTIAYAMLLITGARLGDLLGARRIFLTGLAVFTAASLVCGVAPTTGVLIAARFVQGAGAAGMVPQILAVIQQRFTGPDRARALSVYGAVIAGGAVCGQVLGGLLVSADLFGTGWRPAFLVNVPVGLALLVLVPRFVPSDHVPRGRRLDLPGLVTASGGVLLVVLPLVLGREEGWPAWTWASMAVGAVLLVAFVVVERRVAARGGDPLLDVSVVRTPGMRGGFVALGAGMLAYGGFLFATSLHLQAGLGDSALHAGLVFAPAAATFGSVGYAWRSLPARLHPWLPVVGLPVAGLGYALLALTLHGGSQPLALLVPVQLVTGVGMGLTFSPLLTLSLVRVPVVRAADASGLLATTFQLSLVLGVTLIGGRYLDLAPSGTGSAVAEALVVCALVTLVGTAGAYAVAREARRR